LLIEKNNLQNIKNDQLKKENDILAFEIQNAQNSDEHIENLAREKLGLSYPDEEFITIKNLENIKDD
jgi:cell division protein FtsB